ncbi:MAG: cytochrome P450 [Kordiimonadaceae bacterium]|nr:cytochrome P450 [Kordiimonadaceae bacterium]
MNRPEAPIEIIDPDYYQQNGYPHSHWAELRKNSPIAYCQHPKLVPFYAVTRYEDIVSISKKPNVVLNAPLLSVQPDADEDILTRVRTLLNMDPPDHRTYRKLMSAYFTKRRLNEDQHRLDKVADQILNDLADKKEMDFVTEVSAILPLAVIAELMGLPQEDRDQFFRWTNEIVGANDPEFQRADGLKGRELAQQAIAEVFAYCTDFVEDRRKHPQDDLTTILATAKIDNEYLPPLELLSYLFLLIAAGNETTRNATTGGMLALIQHPDQLQMARKNPDDFLYPMVEEIVRWTSPVIHFCRTPNTDVTLHGVDVKAGEHLTLFYPSANRDTTVFNNPDVFDITRDPNQHLGFGIGEHLCLGAHLARNELRAVFRSLLMRLKNVELVGNEERLRSGFIGGVKHMNVRLDIAA